MEETGMERKIISKTNQNKYAVNFNEHIRKDNFSIKINHLDYQQKVELDELVENINQFLLKVSMI